MGEEIEIWSRLKVLS